MDDALAKLAKDMPYLNNESILIEVHSHQVLPPIDVELI